MQAGSGNAIAGTMSPRFPAGGPPCRRREQPHRYTHLCRGPARVRLDLATWPEIEAYLGRSGGIIIPAGSTEQHGPMGLIGTDAICAERVATGASEVVDAMVAPTLAYTPAPFNMAFPGTISVSEELFENLVTEILSRLSDHGFDRFYFANGHGANLAPLERAAAAFRGEGGRGVRIRSWWDFETVDALRRQYYGDWEGVHATPSEVAITQATCRIVPPGDAASPPERLPPGHVERHAGDRYGPPDEHRRRFPDGRVGSHSALATPAHGAALLEAAAAAMAEDYAGLMAEREPGSALA